MSLHTPIEWCDSTVNPTSGCDGCELFSARDPDRAICYAKQIHENRFAMNGGFVRSGNYARSFSEVRMIPGRIDAATHWRDLSGKTRDGKPWLDSLPRCIFVGDLADVMSEDVTDDFIEHEIFLPMVSNLGCRHLWIVLTKRPSRLAAISAKRGGLPANCVAMTSVTSQVTANARIPHLLRVRARYKGISAEPLFEPISLSGLIPAGFPSDHLDLFLDWVIIGGASGANAPACDVGWIRRLAAECQIAGIATFVKQLGTTCIGVESTRAKKGGDWNEWPDDLRIREMPDFKSILAT